MQEELLITVIVSSKVNAVTLITYTSDESLFYFLPLALEVPIDKAVGFLIPLRVDYQLFQLFRPANFSVFFVTNENAGELIF